MATDLAGFERAYRLRSTADDQLLAQIFGEEELKVLRTSNPNLIETARGYFPHLTSSTYDRLVREPDSLRYEKDRCEREMEQLAVQNYGAFISNAKVTTSVQQELVDIQRQLDEMVEAMEPVQEGIESFQARATDLSISRASLRNVKEQHSAILELLELPQLLDACIRNQMYDESLELLAYCNNMFQSHESRGEDIPVLQGLCEQVATQKANLQSSLVAQLKTDIHLPACVRVMGFLRRLQQHSEDDLRLLFIMHRGAFLEGHRLQVEALCGNRGSVVTALRNAADLLRTHVFDIGMQYKALFAQEDGPLCAWLTEQIMWLTELLRAHVLPPSRQSSQSEGRGVAAALRGSTGARIDAPALATVLRQCLHASSTLKRLGGNFFPAVAGIFEARMQHHVCEMLDIALLTFHAELGRYDWVASTALAGASGAGGAGDGGATHGGVAWLHPQALELTRHRPLAVLCNDLVQMFNELRQCTLFGLRASVVNHCSECLTGAINVLRSVRGTQQLQAAKAVEFSRMCQHFARILTPLVSSHLEAIFGAGARLDVTAIVTAMTPDLLPSSELEVELPVDGASWDVPDSSPPQLNSDAATAEEPLNATAREDATASEPPSTSEVAAADAAGVPDQTKLLVDGVSGGPPDSSPSQQSSDAAAAEDPFTATATREDATASEPPATPEVAAADAS